MQCWSVMARLAWGPCRATPHFARLLISSLQNFAGTLIGPMNTKLTARGPWRRAWGQVRAAKLSIAGQRSRPRMGKAISIQLEVPERAVQEWFGGF